MNTNTSNKFIGILLTNLGTPDEPTKSAVRRYLKQFLSDRRVVDLPRILWWPLLNFIILNTRPAKSAAKYQSIWMKEGSPLRVYTERQTQLLRGYLGEKFGKNSPLKIEYAMRYGNPSIKSGMDKLKAAGCENILVLPLYPQYADSTTASTMDALQHVTGKAQPSPELRLVKSFHDHPAYIDAIVKNLLAAWMKIGRPDFSTDRLLMTFHGLPQFHIDRGDPYQTQCLITAQRIADALELNKNQYLVTFQSRFGRTEWIKPYTDKTLAELAAQGIKRVDVICPGFTADCLETLEEIAIEGREIFMHAGGKEFNYIPVTNDTEPFMHALTAIAQQYLQGWVNLP